MSPVWRGAQRWRWRRWRGGVRGNRRSKEGQSHRERFQGRSNPPEHGVVVQQPGKLSKRRHAAFSFSPLHFPLSFSPPLQFLLSFFSPLLLPCPLPSPLPSPLSCSFTFLAIVTVAIITITATITLAGAAAEAVSVVCDGVRRPRQIPDDNVRVRRSVSPN